MSKLLEENYHQRFYEVDFDINFGNFWKKEIKPISELFDMAYGKNLKKGYSKKEILKEVKRTICISDAITHNERLVFLAHKINGEWSRLRFSIAGKNTMMTEGGNSDDVYDDEVYIRYLRKINNKN